MLEKKANLKSGKVGSALIMTVVLTVLLAIVAVMFVMVARMDSASTSNIVDSKTLDNAAKSIIEIIGKELVLDTPGVANQEYQDYPDVNDAWLANIEPYTTDGTNYYWRQISDVTGYLKDRTFQTRDVLVRPSGSTVVKDYPKIEIVETTGLLEDTIDNANADADGDGIADSKWIELAGINSSKGKKVFAAIRLIDNCAMVNVNTAYKFDANTTVSGDRFRVDGTSQLQINLNGLLKTGDDIDRFHKARGGSDATDDSDGWDNYDNLVSWKYDSPPSSSFSYLPFDISDELELRYRYCIDGRFASRLEADANIPATLRGRGTKDFGNLYDTNPDKLTDWQDRITKPDDTYSDRRHLLTTYSFDRLIDPNGEKMFYVRSANSDENKAQLLYDKLVDAIDKDLPSADQDRLKEDLAQITANMVDQSDNDAIISIVDDKNGNRLYGTERPYIYISEIARNFKRGIDIFGNSVVFRSYAIELFREFETPDGNDIFEPWTLEITNPGISSIVIDSNDFQSRGGQFYVKIFENQNNWLVDTSLGNQVRYTNTPNNGAKNVDPDVKFLLAMVLGYDSNSNPIWADKYEFYISENDRSSVQNASRTNHPAGLLECGGCSSGGLPIGNYDPLLFPSRTYYWKVVGWDTATDVNRASNVYSFTTWDSKPEDVNQIGPATFSDNTFKISLYRPVQGVALPGILVDEVNLPRWITDYNDPNGGGDGIRTFQRNLEPGFRVKRIWDRVGDPAISCNTCLTLGRWNGYVVIYNNPIQPWHHNFTNAGDAAMLFAKKNIYLEDSSREIVPADTEADVRFDMDNPSMQNVFKYITAMMSPYDANETRVRGRININTAPAFVISQLPWVSKANRKDLKIADAIVAYRDKTKVGSSPDYSGLLGRKNITDIDDIYESPGFRSVGELLSVINKSGNDKYNIRYCGMDNQPQYGFPDLQFDAWSMDDGTTDDLEEQELIFARISDLATVRSDTFTAYILVRVGVNGPQKRFIAILDRTGVKQPTDKIKVEAFQQVPAAR
ncbi:MAG TPA: hypothetical protein DDW84_04255 [Phycisphaerales bacterium]|nr:MAG: hypothetical protein A2Y13_05235 [Planctomycetes bacterium GWC2_45_44]HBG78048.1 hypothetical protein [Phycisphaerales bacterium]HBR20122.1 hypothetical protein [Phycisphaerales bacterium]